MYRWIVVLAVSVYSVCIPALIVFVIVTIKNDIEDRRLLKRMK